MISVRRTGAGLVALEALLFAAMTGTVLLPLLAVALAGAALFPSFRLTLAPPTHRRLILYLGVLFLADGLLRPSPPPGVSGFMLFALGWSLAWWLLTLQILHLHGPKGDRREAWFVLAGVLILLAAGNQVLPRLDRRMLFYQLGALTFVPAVLLYASPTASAAPGLRRRLILLATAVILALPLSPALSHGIPWLEGWYNRFFNLQATRHAGFSGLIDLSAPLPEGPDADAVALRIESMNPPGYLRGECFTRFVDGEWSGNLPGRSALPPLAAKQDSRETLLRILPARDMENHLFTPEGCRSLTLPGGRAVWNAHGIARRLEGDSAEYRVRAVEKLLPAGDDATTELRLVPEELSGTLHDIVTRILTEELPVRKKVKLLEAWFQENFPYGRPPADLSGSQAIARFLRERHPAHCQFFATAGALILRRAGIPTRVLAGYVALEKNPLDDYWLARNRDAHAWVEVRDGDGFWFRFDPTPGDGRPGQGSDNWLAYFLDACLHRLTRAVQNFRQEGLAGLGTIFRSIGALFVLILIALVFRHVRRHLHRVAASTPAAAIPPKNVAGMRLSTDWTTGWPGRKSPPRRPDETLDSLDRRLRSEAGMDEIGAALATAARLRYSPAAGPGAGEAARVLLQALETSSSSRRNR